MANPIRTDVLLVTATLIETRAVLDAFGSAAASSRFIDKRVYFDLGVHRGSRIHLTQCEMGAGGIGASQQAINTAIASLSPHAVILVGIAFGVEPVKQQIGDILIAEQIRCYEGQRVGTDLSGGGVQILRDDRPHSSSMLLNLFKMSLALWTGTTVQTGLLLTGAKLIDNLDFRDSLRALEPEAIGGEMEGAGLYVACHDAKVDWIIVKSICDFADGQKSKDKQLRQQLAATNAASLVRHALDFVQISWPTQAPQTVPPPHSPSHPLTPATASGEAFPASPPCPKEAARAQHGFTLSMGWRLDVPADHEPLDFNEFRTTLTSQVELLAGSMLWMTHCVQSSLGRCEWEIDPEPNVSNVITRWRLSIHPFSLQFHIQEYWLDGNFATHLPAEKLVAATTELRLILSRAARLLALDDDATCTGAILLTSLTPPRLSDTTQIVNSSPISPARSTQRSFSANSPRAKAHLPEPELAGQVERLVNRFLLHFDTIPDHFRLQSPPPHPQLHPTAVSGRLKRFDPARSKNET